MATMDITPKVTKSSTERPQFEGNLPKKKEKFNWKRFLITLFLVLLTAGVTGTGIWYLMDQNSQKIKNDNAKELATLNAKNAKSVADLQKQLDELEKTDKSSDTETPETDWHIYQNTQYGFQLTFPDSWKGYKVFKGTTDWGSDGNVTTFLLTMPTTDATWSESASANVDKGYASIVAIDVFSHDQWKSISSQEGPTPTYISENNSYVFAYEHAQAGPQDWPTNGYDSKAVIASFKFL